MDIIPKNGESNGKSRKRDPPLSPDLEARIHTLAGSIPAMDRPRSLRGLAEALAYMSTVIGDTLLESAEAGDEAREEAGRTVEGQEQEEEEVEVDPDPEPEATILMQTNRPVAARLDTPDNAWQSLEQLAREVLREGRNQQETC